MVNDIVPAGPSQSPEKPHDSALLQCTDMVSVIAALENKRFRFCSEIDLQNGIEQVLKQSGLAYEREKHLTERDRPDFMVGAGLAIEVKIKGTLAQALRQISRYTDHQRIDAVLLVGTPYWMRDVPQTINGKPIYAMRLTSSLV